MHHCSEFHNKSWPLILVQNHNCITYAMRTCPVVSIKNDKKQMSFSHDINKQPNWLISYKELDVFTEQKKNLHIIKRPNVIHLLFLIATVVLWQTFYTAAAVVTVGWAAVCCCSRKHWLNQNAYTGALSSICTRQLPGGTPPTASSTCPAWHASVWGLGSSPEGACAPLLGERRGWIEGQTPS